MHTLVAASLFDSPWVLAIIVVVSMVSNWLMKRRQASEADQRPDGAEPLPSPGEPEDSQRQPDLQDVLRQLLGGEPPVQVPPPPVPPVLRDAQLSDVGSIEKPLQTEQKWADHPEEADEAARPPAIQTAPPSRPHPTLTQASAIPLETSQRHPTAARSFPQLDVPRRQAAAVVNPGRRPSSEGARAAALVRDPRTVRQAFVVSLVFGPPKAFES